MLRSKPKMQPGPFVLNPSYGGTPANIAASSTRTPERASVRASLSFFLAGLKLAPTFESHGEHGNSAGRIVHNCYCANASLKRGKPVSFCNYVVPLGVETRFHFNHAAHAFSEVEARRIALKKRKAQCVGILNDDIHLGRKPPGSVCDLPRADPKRGRNHIAQHRLMKLSRSVPIMGAVRPTPPL
jgi:hypothetical protein